MPKTLPPVDYLHKLLRYDPETGKLYWRERTPDTFTCSATRSSEHICANWNSKWSGVEAFTQKDGSGYHQGLINGKTYKAAHVIWAMTYGVWPAETGFVVDHRDNDRANNRATNLRLVSLSKNARKRLVTKVNASGVIGVTFDKSKNKWTARITTDQGRVLLGRFASFDDAVCARKNAEAIHGYGRHS